MTTGLGGPQVKRGRMGQWVPGLKMGSMVIWMLMGWAVMGMHAQGVGVMQCMECNEGTTGNVLLNTGVLGTAGFRLHVAC